MLSVVSKGARSELEGVSALLVPLARRANMNRPTSNVLGVKIAKVDAFIVLVGFARDYSSSLHRLATVNDQGVADDESRRIRAEP